MTADLGPEILKKRNLPKGRSLLAFFRKDNSHPSVFHLYAPETGMDYFLRRLGVKLISSAGINTALSFAKTASL